MKPLFREFVRRSMRSDFVWGLCDRTLVRLADLAGRERRRYVAERRGPSERDRLVASAIKDVFSDLTVRHGPFQGMRYPAAVTAGGALFPKLVGCYEREIHPILDAISRESYEQVVVIGCAEGYYAVGLAMRLPSARVFAYDSNPAALDLLREMARANGVHDRVVAGHFCAEETLLGLPLTGRSLILSDCEGSEKSLFTERVARGLSDHDFLIEIHNFVDITISQVIRERFADTHEITAAKSLDDIEKAYTYSYPELRPYGLEARRFLLGECRPTIMEWLYLRSRGREPLVRSPKARDRGESGR